MTEELDDDGPAGSTLRVRSRKLSNVRKGYRMGDQNLLCRAPPCFRRHIKLLVPAAFALVSIQFQGGLTSGRRSIVKLIAVSITA
jgi:hypothetical protein